MTVYLDVFPEGGWVSVALPAAWMAALVGFVHEMGPCVLEPVGGVGVGLPTPWHSAHVRLFTCVGSSVDAEVFLSTEALLTLTAHVRPLVGVGADVDKHLVSSVEALGPGAPMPKTEESAVLGGHVGSGEMRHQLVQALKAQSTADPFAYEIGRFLFPWRHWAVWRHGLQRRGGSVAVGCKGGDSGPLVAVLLTEIGSSGALVRISLVGSDGAVEG